MKRACGTAFLLGALFFFPFPNLLIAPGYGQLPDLHVPSVNEVVRDLPESVRGRVEAVRVGAKRLLDDSTDVVGFYSSCVRGFIFRLGARLFTSLP